MLESGATLGGYKLLRRLGAGGMAEVFLAAPPQDVTRPVAIKTILSAGADGEGVELFLDEARIASLLEHNSIAQTLDLGFENGTLFIVMEYVGGPSLSRIMYDLAERGLKMSPRLVAYIGTRIATALDYAWSRAIGSDGAPLRVIHRDVTPQNILISRSGDIKLTDFGVARASSQAHRTQTGQVRGKAAYMAPEQVRAETLDGRTDIFALALVMYEAITGVRPFQRNMDVMSMRAVVLDEITPIEQLTPSVTPELAAAITRGLAKRPNDRHESSAEFARALEQANRGHSKADIEQELRTLLDTLYASTPMPEETVEAWEPTIAGDPRSGSRPLMPPKLDSNLSEEIVLRYAKVTAPKIAKLVDESPRITGVDLPQVEITGDMLRTRNTTAAMKPTPLWMLWGALPALALCLGGLWFVVDIVRPQPVEMAPLSPESLEADAPAVNRVEVEEPEPIEKPIPVEVAPSETVRKKRPPVETPKVDAPKVEAEVVEPPPQPAITKNAWIKRADGLLTKDDELASRYQAITAQQEEVTPSDWALLERVEGH